MSRFPCPYCSQIVDAGAVACSTCGGLLTIGSPLAIRQALAADPTLSLKDPDSVARLKEFVNQIDESISASERSKLEAEIQKEQAEKEVLRLQQEKEKAKQLEEETKRKEYLDTLPSFKRFLVVQKIPIAISLVLITIAAVAIPSQMSVIRENQRIENEKSNQEQVAIQELTALFSNADKQIADLESDYCLVLEQVIAEEEVIDLPHVYANFDAIENAHRAEKIEADKIYQKYFNLKLNLGSEASKFSSPLLEKHVVSWSYDWFQANDGRKPHWDDAYSLCS
jgi:hypothetical protein